MASGRRSPIGLVMSRASWINSQHVSDTHLINVALFERGQGDQREVWEVGGGGGGGIECSYQLGRKNSPSTKSYRNVI